MTTTETLRVPFELNISSIVAADNCHSQPKFAIYPDDPLKTDIPDIQPDLTVITTLRRRDRCTAHAATGNFGENPMTHQRARKYHKGHQSKQTFARHNARLEISDNQMSNFA